MTNDKPVLDSRVGKTIVTVWKNKSKLKEGSTYHTFEIKKSYFDEPEQTWKDSNTFNRAEIQDLLTNINFALSKEVKVKQEEGQ